MPHDLQLRTMQLADYDSVAALICDSTNAWYKAAGKPEIFAGGAASCRVFCDVYEALDPGCCILAESASGKLMGSCFFHPRPTHIALGIMNVHPDFFGHGVARALLTQITNLADRNATPVRLVSSAMNLDSFSLYTRAGFVPRAAYQDMFISVPPNGFKVDAPGIDRVRAARMDDIPALAELEMQISHIRREKDYQFFIANAQQIWHMSVIENPRSGIDGFLASVKHPGSNMLGPGVARTQADAAALIAAELRHHPGRSPVFLVPVECAELVQTLYRWGARNCETHFHQVRGDFTPFAGVAMPTFMPETG